ncbi:MAG: hypothetical protein MI743_21200, partial [Sneathiellales bacterium]|nr:hypothetical protein [Sneathiellales bacterium]
MPRDILPISSRFYDFSQMRDAASFVSMALTMADAQRALVDVDVEPVAPEADAEVEPVELPGQDRVEAERVV